MLKALKFSYGSNYTLRAINFVKIEKLYNKIKSNLPLSEKWNPSKNFTHSASPAKIVNSP